MGTVFTERQRGERKGKGLREAVLLATVAPKQFVSCGMVQETGYSGWNCDLISHNATGSPYRTKSTGKPLKASHREGQWIALREETSLKSKDKSRRDASDSMMHLSNKHC